MIRVAFVINVSSEWMGGLNYFRNLLYAISVLDNRQIEPVIFMGKKVDPKIRAQFSPYARIIQISLLDRQSLPWLVWKLVNKLLQIDLFDYVLRKNGIDVISHSNMTNVRSCPAIEWIPDFQHLHLPQMFSSAEIGQRNKHFSVVASRACLVVLSSEDAIKDFTESFPLYANKARLLHFVSQPDPRYFSLVDTDKLQLLKKYGITTPYFYLPNQFWKHKNHQVAFEAVNILVRQGIPVTLVCTGHMHDYRNHEHMQFLKEIITKNNLESRIKLLGLVPYQDVFALIRFSELVINPSLFEGWSSTVEECKSVGKVMILSDIDVHKEQYPQAVFFLKNNADDLAQQISRVLKQGVPSVSTYNLVEQTRAFACVYQDVVQECLQKYGIDTLP